MGSTGPLTTLPKAVPSGLLGLAQSPGYTAPMTHPLPSLSSESDWSDLEAELDRWSGAGRQATFWWRDDDAVASTPALDRLLTLADGAPLALAVIPGNAEPSLVAALAEHPAMRVVQHGWRHLNHGIAAKSELGPERPLETRLDELAAGRDRLEAMFGTRVLPMLVPPWNRIGEDLVAMLPALGFRALSTCKPRRAALAAPRLTAVNTHVDLVDWSGSRGFIGESVALALAVDHLCARRLGLADAAEPTGLLTHHLVQDAPTDAFLRQLLALLRAHRGARMLDLAELVPSS